MHNPWNPTDTYPTNRLTWVWANVLYPTIRDMLIGLPTPINLPHNPDEPARLLARVRDTHLHAQHLPADIIALADRALTDAIHAHTTTNQGEREHLIGQSQARTRAVNGYIGIQPEEAGVHDTLTELEV